MDLQNILDNALQAQRAKEMKTSSQLMLGELIIKLDTVTNKELPVVFDYKKYKPMGLGSWRGSYCELSIPYKDGGSSCYEQPNEDCKKDEFGDHDYDCNCGGPKGYDTSLIENPTVNDFLKILNLAMGKYFVGYKGGDYTMGKTTPMWVANHGESGGFQRKKNEYNTQCMGNHPTTRPRSRYSNR